MRQPSPLPYRRMNSPFRQSPRVEDVPARSHERVDQLETQCGRHVALVGSTASGKSWLAMELARRVQDFEIVSVDSMQVYRYMDVGTAKPSRDEREEIAHHLVDLVDPSDDFTLASFQREARDAIADIEARGKRALLVGGTGLYLQAIVDGMTLPGQYPEVRRELERESWRADDLHRRLARIDPLAASRIEVNNRRRIIRALEVTIGSGRPFSSFGPGMGSYPRTRFQLMGVWLPRPVVSRRIETRISRMLADGWIDEVERLKKMGSLSRTASQALGYKELFAYLGGVSLDVTIEEIVRRTRSFARRQRVWFRRDPRIRWHAAAEDPRPLLPALLQDCTLSDATETRTVHVSNAVQERGEHP